MNGESGGTWAYREVVGGLIWLTAMSKPDISSAVSAVARHFHNPTTRRWKAVLIITGCLLGTKDFGLAFNWGPGLKLSVVTYAKYAAGDRRSATGVAVTLGNSVASCDSRHGKDGRYRPPRPSTGTRGWT